MRFRIVATAVAALPLACLAREAAGQVISTPVQATSAGWSVNLTPYFWLTTFRSNLGLTGPFGNVTVTESITAGINEYISNLNFAFMGGAEARYDRFSILTDLVYGSVSFKNNLADNRLQAINAGSFSIPIFRDQQLFSGSRTSFTVGSLAGGYTLASGTWGNVDAVAGLRVLSVSSRFNYGLTADIRLPNGAVILPSNGSLSLGEAYVDGVGGVRGRINLGDRPIFIPFYLDAGGGGVPFTWQAYVGLAYKTNVGDLSIGYRWLDFQKNGKDKAVQNLSMGGAILAAAFHF